MKKIKIALHWQILIALVLAIVYGIIFPTRYQISDRSLRELRKRDLPVEVIQSLAPLKGNKYLTLQSFTRDLDNVLDKEELRNYIPQIRKTAYLNPAVIM